MEPMEITVDYEERSPLMKWLSSIPILKHIQERDIGYMFNDGVLFFHLLRDLFEEKIDRAEHLAGKILPSENYNENLLNWTIINENVMEKLGFGKSGWFLEYLAKGSKEYVKEVLENVRKLAPNPAPKPSIQTAFDFEVIEEEEPPRVVPNPLFTLPRRSYYYNDLDDPDRHFSRHPPKSRRQQRVTFRQSSSPLPRMNVAEERVLRDPRNNRYRNQRRSITPNRFQNNAPRNIDFRYFRHGKFQSRYKIDNRTASYYQDRDYRESTSDSRRDSYAAPKDSNSLQTYCFLDRQRRRRSNWRNWRGKSRVEVEDEPRSEELETRFQQLLDKFRGKPYGMKYQRGRKQYQRYLYRYYQQFDKECNYCGPLIDD